ncbi:SDR family oxidoreductase [Vibrio sp. Of7-15]|uniref:SDR family oxidoreductase n=1 Tax=Vibrio sp. Of7-15 TaxID=2724879 RepID=UPI001EF23423|nr:SDR family oxidoreductase [Vibrio sp. Of7-15]MCG7496333.1 SDR family oxidoreductase [Vibrio sp. Of7-15]
MTKVIVITGATKGLGKKIGCYLAKQQHLVFALDPNESAGFELADFEPRIRFIKANLSNEPDLIGAFESITQQFGRIDTIINNNYEINCKQPHISEQDTALWGEDIKRNFTEPMLVVKQAYSYLKESNGSVINCASFDNCESLSAQFSLAGISAFTESLAVSLKPEVRVNCIASSYSNRCGNEKNSLHNEFQSVVNKEKNYNIDEFIHLVEFLISPKANTLTGQEFWVGGKV